MQSVLIVEDNLIMLRVLQDNLQFKGYRVRTAIDGEDGLKAALVEEPDLIILDIMLPGIDGYDICRFIREKKLQVPIMMITARTDESDQVLGLNLGADDYITKPFSIKVLLARAQALLRREQQDEPTVYEFGDCQLNTVDRTLQRNGRQINLSPGEFKLLHLFLRKPGFTLSCDEILQSIWGYSHFISIRDVDRFINNLRSKIEKDPNNATFLHDAGKGSYRFELS
jgi:two-component system alkaline phosphatase synthesis response regulator PhoP